MEECTWTIIPDERLKNRDFVNTASIFCAHCNKLQENLLLIPYAWDEENKDVISVAKCPICNELMYIRD